MIANATNREHYLNQLAKYDELNNDNLLKEGDSMRDSILSADYILKPTLPLVIQKLSSKAFSLAWDIADMTWHFLKTPHNLNIITSDNPVIDHTITASLQIITGYKSILFPISKKDSINSC